MTTITASGFGFNGFVASRSPRQSFAARLAALQARQEQAPLLGAIAGVVARGALAAVPFLGLAVMFVTL
jgi:hypothetical protein